MSDLESYRRPKSSRATLSRRRFLRLTAAAAGTAAASPWRIHLAQSAGLPTPDASGIEHIIVVMMENRSFDHFLGWVPGAEGKQAGLSYTDAAGASHATYPLAPDYQGCAHPDPDHSYEGGRIELNNGACDGWLRAGKNDRYAIGYYTSADLPFYAGAAQHWTVLDRYFAAIMAPTFPNRIYQHAAQTDRITNTFAISTLPTIWDQLAAKNVSARYYFSDLPLLALWGAKYLPITRPIAEFYADAAAGTLPKVSFVDPRFLGEGLGVSGDDHPHADIRNGQVFLNQIYNAVTSSPGWAKSVLVINYDEWGGFFDHVPPTPAPIPDADKAAGNADGLRGFRVPAFVISPFARRSTVLHETYDHTSVLKMIEWRWGLEPLTLRDKTAKNLADALDFTTPNLSVPSFNVPQGPFGDVCPPDLTLSLKDRELVLSWIKGKGLETATSLFGPWTSITNAISPFTVQIADAARFFRSPNKWIGLSALAKGAGFFN